MQRREKRATNRTVARPGQPARSTGNAIRGSPASSSCILSGVALFAVACLSHAAGAPAFPAKPLRIVISTTAGSGPDVVARLLGNRLTEIWGQPIVVDARPGASGLIGAETTAKASPDGYTMWLGTMTTLIGTLMHQRHRMAESFAPVGLVATTASIFAVHAALPVNSIAELIAHAKSRPGQLLYASTGQGTTPHLCMESFNAMAGIRMQHVPYKASTGVLVDLMGGQVHVTCTSALSWQSLKGGRARGLAVTTRTRSVLAPELPPVAETLPGFEMLSWLGLLAPTGTPPATIATINAAVGRVLQMPDIRERLVAVGAEAAGGTPAAFGAFLHSESARWEKVLHDAGIRPPQ
jgi:tripartite-type tricarboxylate transporter receptor subunit TctC